MQWNEYAWKYKYMCIIYQNLLILTNRKFNDDFHQQSRYYFCLKTQSLKFTVINLLGNDNCRKFKMLLWVHYVESWNFFIILWRSLDFFITFLELSLWFYHVGLFVRHALYCTYAIISISATSYFFVLLSSPSIFICWLKISHDSILMSL